MRELSTLYNARLDPSERITEQSPTSLALADDAMDHSMQSSVTYWVHSDNQVETELFLLKRLILQLPPSPLSSRDIQRSTRTAYLDSSNLSVYNSLVPESPNQSIQFKAPQILWEENSRNKDVVIVTPDGDGGEYKYLSMKRKGLTTFLSSKEEELDLNSPEWAGKAPSSKEEWTLKARKVHRYIHSSPLHPSIITPRLNVVNFSNPSIRRTYQFCEGLS
jgi:SPX domain protein involved in polyphosphate accumulation